MTQNSFIEELNKIGICVTDKQLSQLESYYELLVNYNQQFNLTAITDKESIYLKHFYDSATLYKIVDLNNIDTMCDIGSGAGFPGIVLKILFPNLKITLVDSLNKRINFLNIVIDSLGLQNIEALHARIEEYASINRNKYDLVTARAVASTNILLEYGIPMVKINGFFVAMKGKIDSEPNYENASNLLHAKKVDEIVFKLPFEESNRTLIKFTKIQDNKKYPRKFALIKKNPL